MCQALQCYQQAAECNRDSKQLGDKVRLLSKIVEKKARRGGGSGAGGS